MAEYLLRMGLHPSEVIQGYHVAVKKALEILPTLVCDTLTTFDAAALTRVVKPCIAAKQVFESDKVRISAY
jgi:T-complex protein 1 subunit theta